jgi:hypothetical protein
MVSVNIPHLDIEMAANLVLEELSLGFSEYSTLGYGC